VPKIVLFGATGYTGRLVAGALVAGGAAPLLAGRDRDRLGAMSARLGGLETAVADAAGPESLRALLGQGDVLVSTVGPFVRYGAAAVTAAVQAGAHYVDSTGEAPFIREVFQEYGPRAERAGVALLTAFGYDFVPGNLAGALALRDAGGAARRVDVGYFLTGAAGASAMSSGTRASISTGIALPHHAFRDGRLSAEPGARRVRHFTDDRRRPGFSIGGTEQFALPGLHPELTEVNVYLGWLGSRTRAVQLVSYAQPVLLRLPGARQRVAGAAERALRQTGTGPDAAARAGTGSLVLADAYDAAGRQLCRVRLAGANAYDLTGRLLAYAAGRLAAGEVTGAGALGPVQAFGLDALRTACQEAGLVTEDRPAA
jgi:short subunit dehydrogenase-like uncharacterized protein